MDIDISKARIVEWFEVTASDNEYGTHPQTVGFYDDRVVAEAAKKGKGFYGADGDVHSVVVLTDGEHSYVIDPDQIHLKSTEEEKDKIIAVFYNVILYIAGKLC